MKTKSLSLTLLLVVLSILPCMAGNKKVVVYMMDGMRADMMETLNAPVWQDLKSGKWAEAYKSAWSIDASNEPFLPTNSAPNHTAIATGHLVKDHKVTDNGTFNNHDRDAAPSFLKILNLRKNATAAFAFSWTPDKVLIPDCPSYTIPFDDARNSVELLKLMAREDAPDATLVFDDAPDHGAHSTGFYPFGNDYFKSGESCMARLTKLLDAIKGRPKFNDEDWLIVICSDHGGYGKSHGMPGGQASTVPLLFCSKSMPAGRIVGRPNNLSIVPIVLQHFGLDVEARQLPGYAEFRIAAEKAGDLSNGLLYDIQGKDGNIINAVPNGGAFTVHGNLPVDGSDIELGKGYISLDSLRGDAAKQFSFAFTIELDPASIKEDPPIFSNKDWKTGMNEGFCAFIKNKGFMMNFGCNDRPVTFLAKQKNRLDLYQFDLDANKKSLFAVSVGREGLITLLQKHPDGNTYWFSVKQDAVVSQTNLNWNIGQDGTGIYQHHPSAKISGFRFWNRPLTLEELRSL